MQSVLTECARILNCSTRQLNDKMAHPSSRGELLKFLKGRLVRTTYRDRNGVKKVFTIGGITRQRADSLNAYGKLSRIFNVTVAQFFYCRHGIRLLHPFLPCIIEHFGPSAEDHYYPLELLEFVVEREEVKPGGLFIDENVERLFAEIDNDDRDDIVWEETNTEMADGWGRDECSQSNSDDDDDSIEFRCHHYGGPIDCTKPI